MQTNFKNLLQEVENKIEASKNTEQILARKIFPKHSRLVPILAFFTAAVTCLFLFVINRSPLQTLSAQEVLAQSIEASTVTKADTITVITRTIAITSQQIKIDNQIEKVWTDGTRFLNGFVLEDGTTQYNYWTEKNIDGQTFTSYFISNEPLEIQRDFTSNLIAPDLALFGFSNANQDAINLCDEQGACNTAMIPNSILPTDNQEKNGATVTITLPQPNEQDYRITITGVIGRFTGVPRSITRELFINKDTMKIEKRTWDATMPDGSRSTGEFTYTYEYLPLESLGHPFTLQWWKDAVDPQHIAINSCVIDGVPCEEAKNNPSLIIPDSWLEENN